MPLTICVHELGFVHADNVRHSAALVQWNIEISDGSRSMTLSLSDPSSRLRSQQEGLAELDPEAMITWYLDDHSSEPLETAKCELAADLLAAYGRDLASQLAAVGWFPRSGHVQLQIFTPRRTDKAPQSGGPSLQNLHWEVLEDVTLWPGGFGFDQVSIVRSLTGTPSTPGATATAPCRDCTGVLSGGSKKFNILLVVSRPGVENAVEYQLVAKSLVAIVNRTSETEPRFNISLTILRPPTWLEFWKHLDEFRNHYNLVHFDMKGSVSSTDDTGAVLEFCKPDLRNPRKMRPDPISGARVGEVLAKAGVRTVILNACESASFRDSAPGSNLAEVLMEHGVRSVLAMAYKVTEEAVELFMGEFYRSLLAEGTSIEDATRVARCVLLRDRSRRAWYMQRVQLSDFVVPVLYVSELRRETAEAGNKNTAAPGTVLGSLRQAASAMGWITGCTCSAPSHETEPTDLPQELFGRDYNILSLETHLSALPRLLLYGQGGVGKTELLRYACAWWKSSGWIKASAYIDFDQQKGCLYNSMEAVVGSIARQLHLQEEELSADGTINRPRTEKYLIVIDSAEVFDTENELDRIRGRDPEGLATHLAAFIDKVTSQGSLVIVASRLSTSKLAPHWPDHLKYRLPGLSVLDSVTLLQSLAFEFTDRVPDTFYRRQNIDYLRRAATLLEGNPLALSLVVPELKRVNYDGETLLDVLLCGVCETLMTSDPSHYRSRFEQSFIACTVNSFGQEDDTGMAVYHLGPFWNLMPRDLAVYHWFLHLKSYDGVPEYSIQTWLSNKFRRLVEMAPLGQKMRAAWPDLEQKMISTGIISHATVTKKGDDGRQSTMPCYHVHPICTLLSRKLLSEEGWQTARFAYVRAALLWDARGPAIDPDDWSSVSWDGADAQHEDHLYNWRHTALAWCVRDGNPWQEESRTGTGVPLFNFVYKLATRAVSSHPRQARLVAPLLRSHLLQRHMMVALFRPGGVPTGLDLSAILSCSWDLWTLETSLLNAPHADRAAVVDAALDVYRRRAVATPTAGEPLFLGPADEASYQQLLFATAYTADEAGDFVGAKALYEAHLAISPATKHAGMLNLIRRCQFQSLTGWNTCVFVIATCMGDVDEKAVRDLVRSGLGAIGDDGTAGGLGRAVAERMKAHPEEVTKVRVRDHVAFGLQREPETEKRFGWFARRLLDEPLYTVFADAFDREGQGKTPERILWEMAELTASDAKALKRTRGRPMASTVPGLMGLGDYEAALRIYAGDSAGASASLRALVAKEALSSTTSTGWQRFAELHMVLYKLAVEETAEPDYKKGLTHLQEWWNLHQGQGMAKRSQCCALIDFAKCYHGLGQVTEASKAVLKLVHVAKSMAPADCLKGDVEATYDWVYEIIFAFDKLHVFLDPKVVFFRPPGVELGWGDRAVMHQIVTEARERQRKKELKTVELVQGVQRALDNVLEALGRIKEA